jgi:hypothetical protein
LVDRAPNLSDRHCALARSLVSHFVNTPMAIVVGAVDQVEAALRQDAAKGQRGEAAREALADARGGLDRLANTAGLLLGDLGVCESREGLGAVGRVLVVTGDASARAAICAALRGDSITVCESVAQALRLIERAEPFEIILCDALLSVAWLLVRVAWQEPAPCLAFLCTQSSDASVVEFLRHNAIDVLAPVDVAQIRVAARA